MKMLNRMRTSSPFPLPQIKLMTHRLSPELATILFGGEGRGTGTSLMTRFTLHLAQASSPITHFRHPTLAMRLFRRDTSVLLD